MIEKIQSEMINIIGSPMRKLIAVPFKNGKFLRADLCFTVGKKYNVDEKRLLKFAAIIELLHLASLIHDDVIDCSENRREVLSENKKNGNKNAVLSGDYIIMAAFTEIERIFNSQMRKFILQAVKEMILKELEHNIRKNDYSMTLDDYFSINKGKTGSLFGLAAVMGGCLMEDSEETRLHLYAFGRKIGILYQCVDDIIDLRHDIPNGIMTFPTILILEKKPELIGKGESINNNYRLIAELKKTENIECSIKKVEKMLMNIETECLQLGLLNCKVLDYINKKIQTAMPDLVGRPLKTT